MGFSEECTCKDACARRVIVCKGRDEVPLQSSGCFLLPFCPVFFSFLLYRLSLWHVVHSLIAFLHSFNNNPFISSSIVSLYLSLLESVSDRPRIPFASRINPQSRVTGEHQEHQYQQQQQQQYKPTCSRLHQPPPPGE